VCVYLVNIPKPVQYTMYTTLALPFDLKCEKGTCDSYTMGVSALPAPWASAYISGKARVPTV